MIWDPHDIPREEAQPNRWSDSSWSLLEKLTGFSEPESPTRMRGFSLCLGDGSRWWIAGSHHASFIVAKLGAMMHLQEGDPADGHIMFFYEKVADLRHLELSRLQAQGWKDLHHFFYQLRFHPRLRHFLGEFDSLNPKGTPYSLMSLALPVIYWESVCRGGLPFHAALLEHQGQGVLLAAPGETGKSTCCRRLPPPWRARCDDEVLAVLSSEGHYLAHSFPTWADFFWERGDNSWKMEETIPLAGIFFFEQAPEDECLPLRGAQAAVTAIHSAEQIMDRFLKWCDAAEVRGLRRTMFANACDIVKQIPAFHLRVSLTGRFWEKIEAALRWR